MNQDRDIFPKQYEPPAYIQGIYFNVLTAMEDGADLSPKHFIALMSAIKREAQERIDQCIALLAEQLTNRIETLEGKPRRQECPDCDRPVCEFCGECHQPLCMLAVPECEYDGGEKQSAGETPQTEAESV